MPSPSHLRHCRCTTWRRPMSFGQCGRDGDVQESSIDPHCWKRSGNRKLTPLAAWVLRFRSVLENIASLGYAR
eukprot:SM000001S04687  [mRNA]  locus=s1:1664208:1664673:- [translate_table: standard]